MGHMWTLITHLRSVAGYASIIAIESTSKLDDEQWLAYWILYSFLTLLEMLFQPILNWIPIWYDVKLIIVAWLVLPQFRGATFIYETYVREKIIKNYGDDHGKAKKKNVHFMTPTKIKEEDEDY
ncbi:HVA22-like protein e isoform X2 [Capsicum annuum]|uniref:HVA22-like protein e isoform X2 n=1 Tax=Capsicum annuum TaxID=4072 RepID=UPI0007BEBACC|nr:HVA22-like protein e isoform X2 [Capsicum annuum]